MQGYGTTETHPLLVRIQNSTATLEQLCSFLKKVNIVLGNSLVLVVRTLSSLPTAWLQYQVREWGSHKLYSQKIRSKHSLNHMIQQYLPKLNTSKIKIPYVHTDICIQMFIAALFTVAKKVKETKVSFNI